MKITKVARLLWRSGDVSAFIAGDTLLTAGPGWMCTHQVVDVDLEKAFPDTSTPEVDLVPGHAPDLEPDSRSDTSTIARPVETARGPAPVACA